MCRQFDTITIARMLVGRPVLDALGGDPVLRGSRRGGPGAARGHACARAGSGGARSIFHIGDPGDALFVIVAGEVKISLPSETGEEAILATLAPGDVFGELALLDGAPRSASATALERRPRPSSCRATGSAS